MKAANRGQGPLTAHACLARAVLVLASLARALGAQGKHTFANHTCARAPIKHAHVRQSNMRTCANQTCARAPNVHVPPGANTCANTHQVFAQTPGFQVFISRRMPCVLNSGNPLDSVHENKQPLRLVHFLRLMDATP